MNNKLTIFEAISVIAIITIAQIILDFPKYLINITGTGTIINLLFLFILVIFFCNIISNIFKNFANKDIIDISEFIGGKTLKILISIIFIIFLFLTTISATSNFIYLVKNIYFKNNNFLFISLIFIVSIFIACYKGFSSTKKISSFFGVILAISLICLLFGDNGNFNTNNLVPFFGYNYKTTFFNGITNIFIFNFTLMYFFLMPLISQKNNYKKIVFSSLVINFTLIIISVFSILQYYPTSITEELINLNSSNIIVAITRRIQISSFLSQTDSIFILFWTYAILCYISILIDCIFYILNKNFHYQNQNALSYSIIPIIFGGTIFINNITKQYIFDNYIFKNYSIILTFGISFIITLLGFFKNKKGLRNANFKK